MAATRKVDSAGRQHQARRSPREWGIRIALAIATGLVGAFLVVQSLAVSLNAIGLIREAHAWAPGNGRITASLARMIADAEANPADRKRADALGRLALRQNAMAIDAVTTLGIDAQIRGDSGLARRLFAYARLLSRRDLQTSLWAIQDAVNRGDVAGALTNYDAALRTSAAAPDLLFPVLAAASAGPIVRRDLVRTLAQRPPWSGAFIDYLAGNDPDPRATAALFRDMHRARDGVSEGASAALIGSLINAGDADEAWNYYASIRPGVDRRQSRDPYFVGVATPSALDWVPVDDGAVVASIQRSGRAGVLDIAAPPSVGGLLASQLQMLPPGAYRLDGHATGIDQPDGARPYWALSCRDGREFGRVAIGDPRNGGAFAGRVDVPTGCPIQVLSLVALPSELVSGLTGQIERVQLRPLD